MVVQQQILICHSSFCDDQIIGCCGCCEIMTCLGPDMLILCIFFTFVQMINLSRNGKNVMSPEMDSPIFF